MKRFIAAILAASALIIPSAVMAEEDTVSVIVDNEKVEFDQAPIIDDGTTLVPVRAVFEKAGANVTWDQATQTATLVKEGYTVTIKLNDTVLYKNGTQIALAKPAQIINDRVLIPVRAIGEAMDFDINWDGFHSQVVVSTDGTEYRPYAARRTAFRELADTAIYYNDKNFEWVNIDLSAEDSQDTVSFTAALDAAAAERPLLIINGVDYTPTLSGLSSTYSFAVIDTDTSDNRREIVVTENGDKLTAHFFYYNGTTLVPIMRRIYGDDGAYTSETPFTVSYASKLFFDERSFMLADIEGITWTDIMVTCSAYHFEDDGTVTQYSATNASKIVPRRLVHTYNDNMVYKVFYTDYFDDNTKGTYLDGACDEVVNASEITEFTLHDMYIVPGSPELIEFFTTLSDGRNAVLVPYDA